MTILIRPASEIEKHFKVLVYGPPGVGKTTLAATLDPEHTLFINIEGGMLSVAGTKARATDQLRHVKDVEEMFWRIAQDDEDLKWVTTLVVDSATELQTICLEDLVAAARTKNKSRSVDDIWLEDYGKSTAMLKRIFRHFRDLPKHVIMTALSKDIMSDGKKKILLATVPFLTAKLTASLMGYMDNVWYLDIGEKNKRVMVTQPVFPFAAKTRGHRFSKLIGPNVEEPNLATLHRQLVETES